MNLRGEEMMISRRQAAFMPPGDPDRPGEHVGEHVRARATVLSDLFGTKLNTRSPIDTLMQSAFVACTADVITWERMAELFDREREQLYTRLPTGQARVLRKLITADQPKTETP